MANNNKEDLRIQSQIFDLSNIDKAPQRAMLRAVGMKDEDFSKPQVGVATTWAEVTPCNIHLNDLGKVAKEGVAEAGGYPIQFNAITISDGISNGTEGMRFSLPSRDLIADSVETVVMGEMMDGVVTVGGCDKNMPGCVMGMINANLPGIFVYGGTIAPGKLDGEDIDLVSVFEGVGQYNAGNITEERLREIECNACPGPGSCGGMYTANTMASAIEALGLSLPGSASNPAVSEDKIADVKAAGAQVIELLRLNLRPKDILTKKSFENAITVVMALGGSTNAVLHLLAIAHTADVDLTIDDFNEIQARVPHIADLKPSGKYVFQDLFEVGGTHAVMKLLYENGYLHGDCMTVTGKTIAENLADVEPLKEGQEVILPLDKPKRVDGPLIVLKGNLAPDGAVAKVSGVKRRRISGPARVFNSEEEAYNAAYNNEFKRDDVIVVRFCGPKGGPGMPEMLSLTSLLSGKGIDEEVALITDGRFSGGSHGFVVGHVAPEAQDGGPIAYLKDGDIITIDQDTKEITVDVSDKEIAKRAAETELPPLYTHGVLGKYAHIVTSASKGAVTDFKNR